MCNASDYALSVVFGQRKERIFQVIHYASKVLHETQSNYTAIKKELLGIMYALETF